MLTPPVDYVSPHPLSRTNPPETRFDYTAVAIATAADLDDENRIEKMILLGRAISAAKDDLHRGKLTKWYSEKLKRSQSWCSQYYRLYNDREILPNALDWATKQRHKLADYRGIEQLLKIIADYKVNVLELPAPPLRQRSSKQVATKAGAEEITSHLHELLVDAAKDFQGLREEVQTAPPSDVGDAREQLLSLIDRIERRLSALGQTCSGMQVPDTAAWRRLNDSAGETDL
jgi:hypothetical protein